MNTAADLIDLVRIMGPSLSQSGFDVETRLITTLRSLPDSPECSALFQEFNVQVDDTRDVVVLGKNGIDALLSALTADIEEEKDATPTVRRIGTKVPVRRRSWTASVVADMKQAA